MYLINLQLTEDHISSMKKQRAITIKLGSGGLWFLCSALLLNKIYTPLKFHVQICNSLWDSPNKFVTDRRTNEQPDRQRQILQRIRRGIIIMMQCQIAQGAIPEDCCEYENVYILQSCDICHRQVKLKTLK